MHGTMHIRRVRSADAPQIARLYYETIHRVNARDYSPEQIRAWAPKIYPDAWWRRRFKDYQVWVAEHDEEILGFAELESTGHLDCFYVHHLWQGRGVGSALMARIDEEARRRRLPRLFADVSITALPFFLKLGFQVVRRQKRIYRNRAFRLFAMEKRPHRLP
ncbi:MAG: GNAT family N-acetyltransferase [Pseudomonadota bacterium]|nr:GNAT family N-acetyltransferase [Pseudomonadota bacterium]